MSGNLHNYKLLDNLVFIIIPNRNQDYVAVGWARLCAHAV